VPKCDTTCNTRPRPRSVRTHLAVAWLSQCRRYQLATLQAFLIPPTPAANAVMPLGIMPTGWPARGMVFMDMGMCDTSFMPLPCCCLSSSSPAFFEWRRCEYLRSESHRNTDEPSKSCPCPVRARAPDPLSRQARRGSGARAHDTRLSSQSGKAGTSKGQHNASSIGA